MTKYSKCFSLMFVISFVATLNVSSQRLLDNQSYNRIITPEVNKFREFSFYFPEKIIRKDCNDNKILVKYKTPTDRRVIAKKEKEFTELKVYVNNKIYTSKHFASSIKNKYFEINLSDKNLINEDTICIDVIEFSGIIPFQEINKKVSKCYPVLKEGDKYSVFENGKLKFSELSKCHEGAEFTLCCGTTSELDILAKFNIDKHSVIDDVVFFDYIVVLERDTKIGVQESYFYNGVEKLFLNKTKYLQSNTKLKIEGDDNHCRSFNVKADFVNLFENVYEVTSCSKEEKLIARNQIGYELVKIGLNLCNNFECIISKR